MAHPNAPQDVIAEHVRLLLDMDEGRKRAQLANAMKNNGCNASQVSGSSGRTVPPSSYAGSMSTYVGSGSGSGSGRQPAHSGYGGSGSGGSGSGASGHGSGASGSGCEPSYYADSPESSGSEGFAKAASNMPNVAPAPGLSMQWQQDEPAFAPDPSLATTQGGVANASSQLEHATDLLKAALANWESCLNSEEARQEARQVAKSLKKSQKLQQVQTPEQPQSMPVKIPVNSLMSGSAPTQAKSAQAQKKTNSASAGDSSALALQALQQALSDLTGSLPGETAQVPPVAQEDPNMQAVKLLSQHLKKQQEESVQKIMNMMQQQQKQQLMTPKPALDPMASCWPGAGGCNGSWMQMAALGLQQNPALAAAAAGPFGFPSADAGPMANTYGMPPMGMMPGMPWPNQPMPGNSGMSGAHNRRPYEHQAERRQGGNHRNGMGPTKAGPTGMNGNTYRKNRSAAAPPAGTEEETLRKHLRELQKIEPEKVVLVRKINRLGFESPAALEAHYSKYGKVEKVLVAHSHVKSQNCRFAARLRPSGLGFVVMSKKEEADAILALGPEQVVRGGLDGADANIRVQRFQRRSEDAEELMENDDQEEQGW